jgi:hypothetical protein
VKALGANPTDTDLQFIIKYKPKVTDPPQDIAQYLARVQKVFNRSYTDAQKVIESNGTYVPKFEFIKGEVDKTNPLLQGVN